MTLVYCPLIQGEVAFPDQEEAMHLSKVLRKRVGDEVWVTDGKGQAWRATIAQVTRKQTLIHLEEPLPPKEGWGFHLHIALAAPKSPSRLEWFVEKVTEIGVNHITLLHVERSERSPWRVERLQRILVAAMKQSGQYILPQLDEKEEPLQVLLDAYRNQPGNKLIATCDWGNLAPISAVYKSGMDAVILIGPEGDFSPDEVVTAKEAGFQAVILGPNRLRTETAGVVACSQIHLLYDKI